MIGKLKNNNGIENFKKQEKDMLKRILKSKFSEKRNDKVTTAQPNGKMKIEYIPYYKVESSYIDKILETFLNYKSGKIQNVEDISIQIDRIINNNKSYIDNIERMKSDFENRFHGIKFNDDFLTGYINYNRDNIVLNLVDFSDIINGLLLKITIMLKPLFKIYQFHQILNTFTLSVLMVKYFQLL